MSNSPDAVEEMIEEDIADVDHEDIHLQTRDQDEGVLGTSGGGTSTSAVGID